MTATNLTIAAAATASWAVPEIAIARAKRYVAAVKVGREVMEFPSVNKAIQGLNLDAKSRGLRGAMMENGGAVEVELADGRKGILALMPKELA